MGAATAVAPGLPTSAEDLLVELANPASPTAAERGALLERCRRYNMALYATAHPEHTRHSTLLALGESLGLHQLDRNPLADDEGISDITVKEDPLAGEFIPYTDRAIDWHTDGYYNEPKRAVRGLLLHCASPASKGGVSGLYDHRLLYRELEQRNPALAEALCNDEAMAIPAHIRDNKELRPRRTGAVFYHESAGLRMRYTHRIRSIEWKKGDVMAEAVATVREILASQPAGMLWLRLEAGMGLLCNNVLHARTAFVDQEQAPKRLLFRARYYDRVSEQ